MSEVEGFRQLVASVRGNAQVTLSSERTGVVARTGRLARWIGHFRTAENRAVAQRFVASLRGRYGSEVANQVIQSTGLGRVAARGKPLRARHVQQAVRQADVLLGSVRARNTALAQSYSTPVAATTDVSLLQIKVDDAVRRSFATRPTVADLVDRQALGRKVEHAIAQAGREGTHFVTTEEAAGILTDVVNDELGTAYARARTRALSRLALERPDSLSGAALRGAATRHDPPLEIDPARMFVDARENLASRFDQALSDGAVAPHLLDDEGSLRELADQVMGEFVAQRAAAHAAVTTLSILPMLGTEEQAALQDHVLHDNVSAELVPSMGWAYLVAADDVAALRTPMSPQEMENRVAAVRDALTGAFSEAGVKMDPMTRMGKHRVLWRFLLAPGGAAQREALTAQIKPAESPLRGIGEGAMWYQEVFPGTEEANQSFVSTHTDQLEVVYPEASFGVAAQCAVMLSSLAQVLSEDAPGEPAWELQANERWTDQTVATLRNLGIPMPAPDRLGEANPDVPVSASGLAAIREDLIDHLRSKGGGELNKHGVLEESAKDFNRATYRVDGRMLEKSEESVTDALRAFCAGPDGNLDGEMLKNVSLLAYQAGTGCAFATVLDPGRRDIALFNGLPYVNEYDQYNVSRGEDGSVLVDCVRDGPILRLDRRDLDGNVDWVHTDPATSRLAMSVSYEIAASTHDCRFVGIRLGYALHPLGDGPEDSATPEESQVGER